MIRKFILRYFWDFSEGKINREIAERIARTRGETRESPAIQVEKRIKEIWKNAEIEKRFKVVK